MSKDIRAKLMKLAGGTAAPAAPVATATPAKPAKTADAKPHWLDELEDVEDESSDPAEDEIEEGDDEEDTEEEAVEEVAVQPKPAQVRGVGVAKSAVIQPAAQADIDLDALAEKVAERVIHHLRNALNYLPQK